MGLGVSRVRHERGFTLVELLVVFALLALMMGLVPIAFDRLRESAQYRDTLRTMISDLRTARYRAIAEGEDVRFRVNLAERTYGVSGQSSRLLPPSLNVRAVVAGKELTANESAAISFLPDGGATGGSIDLFRPSGAGTRLRVDWLSGQVTHESIAP